MSNAIVKSARFLKMPSSTQNLYFHLIMNADDDGVVEAFSIMRMVGSTEDDLKLLMDKVFVYILNDDLVAYINNWTEHNKVRAERKVDSIYKDLLLQIVPDIEYRETRNRKQIDHNAKKSDNRPTSVRQMSAEDRLGKDRLGKDRIVEVSYSEIQTFYENNGFGTISSKTITDFNYWISDLKKNGSTEEQAIELILKAMSTAVDNNVRKYSYVNAILKDWEQNKLTHVGMVDARELQRQNKSKSNGPTEWKESGDDF